jgi:putative ABC transport system ATP-binding protein
LSGLDRPSSGTIQYGSFALPGKSERSLALFRRKHVGFVFQSFNLVPYLTLLENVMAPAWLRARSHKKLRREAEDLLKEVGIAHLKGRLPAQVSGGEQQRCAIARAFINRPRIVFADEPTGNLNSAASGRVLDLLSHFHSQGQTIVMVTHDPRSAARGDRILFFQDGSVVDELLVRSVEHLPGKADKEKLVMDWLSQKNW